MRVFVTDSEHPTSREPRDMQVFVTDSDGLIGPETYRLGRWIAIGSREPGARMIGAWAGCGVARAV